MQISNCEAVAVWRCSDMYDYWNKLVKKLIVGCCVKLKTRLCFIFTYPGPLRQKQQTH